MIEVNNMKEDEPEKVKCFKCGSIFKVHPANSMSSPFITNCDLHKERDISKVNNKKLDSNGFENLKLKADGYIGALSDVSNFAYKRGQILGIRIILKWIDEILK